MLGPPLVVRMYRQVVHKSGTHNAYVEDLVRSKYQVERSWQEKALRHSKAIEQGTANVKYAHESSACQALRKKRDAGACGVYKRNGPEKSSLQGA